MHNKADAVFERLCYRVGLAVVAGTALMAREDTNGMLVKELRIKGPTSTGRDFLVIVKADIEGRPYVAFHGAESLEGAVQGALERVTRNEMKWREDKPFEA